MTAVESTFIVNNVAQNYRERLVLIGCIALGIALCVAIPAWQMCRAFLRAAPPCGTCWAR